MDKVSIIVPVYNTKKDFLKKCINSLICQTYKNIEIIIIDDGSVPEIADYCDVFSKEDERILIIHKKNEGVSEARNVGISKTTGKWITFVDSDDWIETDTIEKLVGKSENMDVVIAKNFVDNEKQITLNDKDEVVINENYELINNVFLDKPNIQTLGAVWGKLYLREIIINNKVKFVKKIKMGEDYLFNYDFFLYARNARYIQEYLYHYRDDRNESVTRRYDDKLIEKYNLLFEEFEKRIIKIDNINIKIAYEVFIIRQIDYFFFIGIYRFNNLKREERIKILKYVSNVQIYKDAIRNVDLNLLLRGRQAVVILLRLRLYKILDLFLNKKRRYECKKD